MQLLRRQNAFYLNKSIKQTLQSQEFANGETIEAIRSECAALGLQQFRGGSQENKLESETLRSYTNRVEDLIGELGFNGGYTIYSAVAHAALSGLWHLYLRAPTESLTEVPKYKPSPNPVAARSAADGAIKAMLGQIEKIAIHFNWTVPGRGQEMSDTIDYVNARFEAVGKPVERAEERVDKVERVKDRGVPHKAETAGGLRSGEVAVLHLGDQPVQPDSLEGLGETPQLRESVEGLTVGN